METDQIVDELGRIFADFGLNPIVGRIFGVLLVHEGPVSLMEIAQLLELSKPAVSVSIRLLRELGYCRRLPTKADRQHYYELDDDYLVHAYKMRIERQQRHMAQLLQLRDSGPRAAPRVAARLTQLAALQELLVDKQLEGIEEWKRLQEPRKGRRK